MDEDEQEIAMVRKQCGCGNFYWVVPEEDDGQCNACFYADDPNYYLNMIKV